MRSYIYLIVLVLINTPVFAATEYFGEYKGKVKTEWLDTNRKMKLLSDFSFTDPNGMIWLAPKNRDIDGASIPKLVWSFIGSPFSGKYRNASVIHDIACEDKIRTWESVHLAFYYAMRASGVNSVKAKVMYAVVYHAGPRWPHKKLVLTKEKQVVRSKHVFDNSESQNNSVQKWMVDEIPAEYETKLIEPPKKNLSDEDLSLLITQIENSSNELTIEDIQNFSSRLMPNRSLK
ncbi:DUF1353 domain-containing protein [Colwellia sp. PAMC 21821]|uniref:DUF1353 domain-containing protein n=1 Tax=Colwellia sp. PAMC 21821 TaxID=1816219 RepID=UPI0009BFCBCC|nr:DUF1353 domain-containing protein [Colwellia sp. PAMC 21821]ARD45128.1 hypothetical protein A3Q33_12905 [Colwellia sp. PAMC 21821]